MFLEVDELRGMGSSTEVTLWIVDDPMEGSDGEVYSQIETEREAMRAMAIEGDECLCFPRREVSTRSRRGGVQDGPLFEVPT